MQALSVSAFFVCRVDSPRTLTLCVALVVFVRADNSANVPSQEVAKSPLAASAAATPVANSPAADYLANNNNNNNEDDIDVNALLANMQSDINDAGTDTSMTMSAPMAEEVAQSDSIEVAADASDADVLSQFKTMMMSADANTSVSSEVVACEVVAPVVSNTVAEESSAGSATTSAGDDTAESAMATVEMSIADRCAALLSSVSINPIPTDDSCNTSDIIMMDSSTIHEYTDMSDQVAKFALEAMNEDEPKYTEKEMDVLHKKAKIEAAQAFEEQKQALLAQMKMMEAKMQEHQKEKTAMKAEMEEVNQLVAGFESMADSVAKKKDDEIYQLFESKKQVEQELKDTIARCEALQAEVKEAGERKAMGELQHSEEINTIKDAHRDELVKVQAQLQEVQSAKAEIQAELEKTRSTLTNAEKQRAQFETANKRLKAELDEATANADKYKHLGAKTRDQAQAQLDKAKQLVIGRFSFRLRCSFKGRSDSWRFFHRRKA